MLFFIGLIVYHVYHVNGLLLYFYVVSFCSVLFAVIIHLSRDEPNSKESEAGKEKRKAKNFLILLFLIFPLFLGGLNSNIFDIIFRQIGLYIDNATIIVEENIWRPIGRLECDYKYAIEKDKLIIYNVNIYFPGVGSNSLLRVNGEDCVFNVVLSDKYFYYTYK